MIRRVECGGGGDCMFHCLARLYTQCSKITVNMRQMRELLATAITQDNVKAFIELKASELRQQHTSDFQELVRTIDDRPIPRVRSLVRTCGTKYQGTDVDLKWLCQYSPQFVDVGFMVLSSFGIDYYTLIQGDEEPSMYIMLFNDAVRAHWQLLTINNSSFVTPEVLPDLIRYLKDKEHDVPRGFPG